MKMQIAAAIAIAGLYGCQAAPPASTDAPAETAGCRAAIAYSDARRGYSVLAMQDGDIVCSSGGASITTPYELWSGTKSFVGVMAAAAVQDGLLDLDEKAAETLTEWAADPVKSEVTLRQILWMVEGQPSEIGNPPGYQGAVEVPFNAEPGARYQYGPVPMQVFGEVMQRKLDAAGLDADPQAYLDRRILQPLGITQYQWRSSDKDGKPLMPQGALLSAEEWLAFGEFILRGGQSEDGDQLVDPAAFDAMLEGSPANAAYGLTWWLGRPTSSQDPITSASDIRKNLDKLPGDLVYASGAGNQRLYIIPSRDMVIVRQAELDIEALMSGTGTPWVDTHFLTLLLDGEAASNIVTGTPAPINEATVADTPSEATTPDGQFITWREHLIDAEDVNGGEPVRGGDGLIMADLDRDGRDDIISVHEDSGHVRIAFAGSSPDDWHLVTLAHGDRVGAVEDVAVGDLNADGWPDLMAACEDAHLIYFENPGETARTHEWDSLIPEVTTGRGSWLRVFIADLNGDGTLDVTAANKGAADIVAPDDAKAVKSTTSLFLLDGPPLQQGSWREQVLLSRGIANTAQPIDVDGDGDLDVLAAARNRQELILLENRGAQADGTLDIAARDIAIAPGFDAPEGWGGQSNAFQSDWADLDRDGRPDLVLNVLETVPGETPQLGLGWLEQPSALDEPWIFHRIGNTLPDWIAGLELADIDGDGYLDVMTGGYSGLNILAGAYSGAPRLEDDPDATPSDTVGRMAWFQNPGAAGREWTRHDISRRVRGMYDAFVAVDLDADGDTDFVSTRGNSGNLDGVFWLEQVRSDEAQPAFSAARAEDSRQMPLPPENWLSSYRTERTYKPASNTQE